MAKVTTLKHELLGVTISNSYGRIAVCVCGWASPVVPAARNKQGGMKKDQSDSDDKAKALFNAHKRRPISLDSGDET